MKEKKGERVQEILNLVQRQEVCVLATVAGTSPHCSLMAYISDKEGRTLFMITHRDTKKYANMCANPAVSLLIDSRLWNETTARSEIKALTVKGTFRPIDDEQQKALLRKRFISRHGHLKAFAEDDRAIVFAVAVQSFQLQRGAVEGVYADVDQGRDDSR